MCCCKMALIMALNDANMNKRKDISWTKTDVKTQGIHDGYEINKTAVWMEKMFKIKSCIQIWKTSDL